MDFLRFQTSKMDSPLGEAKQYGHPRVEGKKFCSLSVIAICVFRGGEGASIWNSITLVTRLNVSHESHSVNLYFCAGLILRNLSTLEDLQSAAERLQWDFRSWTSESQSRSMTSMLYFTSILRSRL